jgi:Transposase DDE domain
VLGEGAILLGDDAFGGYSQIALLLQQNLHGVFPSHHARIVDFTPRREGGPGAGAGQPRSKWIRSLGRDDQIVELYKPPTRPKWLTQEQYDALPASMQVREIRRKIYRKGFRPLELTVVTTLLDAERYPADEVVALRAQRWEVETDIRHLKTTMKMEVLRSQTAQGVLKELAVFTIVYNLVRAVMLASARKQRADPMRLSFADALAWVCHAEAGQEWPRLKVVPRRPNRIEPRAVKRRPKPFDLMNRPRDEMRKHCLTLHKRR